MTLGFALKPLIEFVRSSVRLQFVKMFIALAHIVYFDHIMHAYVIP